MYDEVDLEHVPRAQNADADVLVNAALDAPRPTCRAWRIGADVLLWYVGLSVLLVANVFRSVGVDYRLIAVGSLLPLAGRPPGRAPGVRAHAGRSRCCCSSW